MWKVVNPSFYDFTDHPFGGLSLNPRQYQDALDEAIYGSDEFRMYAYKIKRCIRTRSHDWTDCPYAHEGEKAQRRDPRKVPYCAIACPTFRNGKCPRGDTCEFAHGVFEYWLHPARYRTRACNAGRFCQRKVCFFAHTRNQLRPEAKHKRHFAFKEKINGRDRFMGFGRGKHTTSASIVESSGSPSTAKTGDKYCFEEISEILKSLRGLKISEEEGKSTSRGVGIEVSDFPNIEWISDLVR
ncbi:zinc finger CCCH domain-containing protein 54-like [Mangifera indica]|uniref:zinc finger CCCH domain-containing protein 54-like n=1 Tax=Mangifera indica TaxID=29780 RepID=UPI001CFC0FC3|nr:zinc finger CCCH domain-containing protein 54-like [Mangifera indica]